MRKPEITFFGSGPVAAKSLELLARDFNIEAVITKPQPPHHKEPFPVLEISNTLKLKVFTPNNKTELSDLFKTSPVRSRLGIVIDYGFIINQDVIDYFPLGIINSHFSLLPEWRGADPISFSILSGQKQTGVSVILITAGMDEGPIVAIGMYDIPEDTTTPILTEYLIKLSNSLLQTAIPKYISGEFKPQPQEWVAKTMNISADPTYSRKLTKEDGIINWSKPAVQIDREIRAFIEWPKSRAKLAGKDIVITKASVIDRTGDAGSVIIEDKSIIIHCGKQSLSIEKLKPAGKSEMTSEAFLAGYRKYL